MSYQESWPPTPVTGDEATEHEPDAERLPKPSAFDVLSDARRRRVLRQLLEHDAPVSTPTLAAEVARADEAADRSELVTELRHVHLPALESAGLVRWGPDTSHVQRAEHPAYEDDTVRRVLETDADVDDLLDALADDRRRLVLAVCYTYGGPVDRATVAQKVAELEADEEPGEAVVTSDLRVSLQHVHLPKLEDAGLLRRDEEEETLQYLGHPDVAERWYAL